MRTILFKIIARNIILPELSSDRVKCVQFGFLHETMLQSAFFATICQHFRQDFQATYGNVPLRI